MGKDNNSGESQFGFKDRSRAEETLKLLEKHEMQYRKLTVRGLLGRAKRVLSMTKAEDKINNIKEAMEVFEKWLEVNGGNQSSKNAKTDPEDKVEAVSGLGFKDKETAENTLKILEGRDPDYQKLSIKGLLTNAKRVLSGTKNNDKINAIKAGTTILEEFLEKFDRENRSNLNNSYLTCDLIANLPSSIDVLAIEFLDVYTNRAKGNYKHLRTLYPEEDETFTWDIVRNKKLNELKEKIKKENLKLFDANGCPSDEHLQMIHWAYSPQIDKVKLFADKQTKSKGFKRKLEQSESPEQDEKSDTKKKQK